MSNHKKRKLKHIRDDSRANSSPLKSKRHDSSISETPHHHQLQTAFTASPAQKFKHHNYEHSDTPSPRSLGTNGHLSSMSELNQKSHHRRYDTIPPPTSTVPVSKARDTMPSHSSRKSQRATSDKQHSNTTIINPPTDPWANLTSLDALKAQNRRRGRHHQTFTVDIPSESSNGSNDCTEIPTSVQDSSRGSKSGVSDGSGEELAKLDTMSESDSETESGLDEDTDSETDTGNDSSDEGNTLDNGSHSSESIGSRTNDNHNKKKDENKTKRPKQEKFQVKPAAMGRDLFEETQRKEKARMEKAAQRAIDTLHATAKKPQRKPQPSSNLTKSDLTALRSLRSLIPPHILSNARNRLQNPPQHQTKRQPVKSEQDPEPSNLLGTLTAARTLILQLSGSRLGGQGPGPGRTNREINHNNTTIGNEAAITGQNEAHVQNELVRITKEREQMISRLESEIRGLKGRN